MRLITDYLQRLLSLWWLVLLVVITAGGTATATAMLAPHTYTATATVLVRPAPGFPLNRDLTILIRRGDRPYIANTIMEAATRPQARDQAAAAAGLSPAAAEAYDVNMDARSTNQHIIITVTGPEPGPAAAYANSLARLADQMAAGLFRVITLETVEAATPPADPSRPNLQRDLPLALSLGLVLGVLLAVFYDYLAH
jgi:capsular polysaccharide biosynthesis protein